MVPSGSSARWKQDAELIAMRDYFRVEDEAGERFWIYRIGNREDATTGSRRRFLQWDFRMSAARYVELRLQPFHDLHFHAIHSSRSGHGSRTAERSRRPSPKRRSAASARSIPMHSQQ
jgi:hypothetical protein